MTLQLGIYASPTGALVLDATYRASGLSFSSGEHGDEQLSAFIRLPLADAFRLFDYPGLLHVALYEYGGVVWEGRLENVSIQRGGIQIAALGYWRALSDVPYIALWSKTTLDGFRPFTSANVVGATPDRYEFSTDEYVYIAPKQGATFGNTAGVNKYGILGVALSNGSTRPIIGASFDYTFVTTVANWRADFQSRQRDYTGIANDWTVTSAGAGTQTGSVNITGMSALAFTVNFIMSYNAANAVYAGETGDAYLKITNLRLVTATTNRINTTLTANRTAGAGVTATVGSTARMYAGQRLQIGGTISESVLVTSVTNSTQFVATFAQNHVIGNTVQAHVVYPDEIVGALAVHTNAVNATQLQSTTTFVQSPAIDLLDEAYEAESPADIITKLCALGDNQTTPRRWGAGVKNRTLYYQYHGYGARTWYVDITDLQLEKTLDALHNSVFAKYQLVDNRLVYASTNADATSIAQRGVTRRTHVDVSTTSATQAGIQRNMVLSDHKDPPPKAQIQFTAVYDAGGGRYPLTTPRAGDTFVIRNLSTGVVSNIDRIRSFRVSRVEYDADNNTLTIEPEIPPDTLEFALTRKEKGL